MKRIVVSIILGAALVGNSFADDRIKDRKENQQDRIANAQSAGAVHIREVRNASFEPPFALSRTMDVVAETKQQKPCRQQNKPADDAFQPA